MGALADFLGKTPKGAWSSITLKRYTATVISNLYSLELTRRVKEINGKIADYQKAFEAIRELFSREIDEIEESLGVVLE